MSKRKRSTQTATQQQSKPPVDSRTQLCRQFEAKLGRPRAVAKREVEDLTDEDVTRLLTASKKKLRADQAMRYELDRIAKKKKPPEKQEGSEKENAK